MAKVSLIVPVYRAEAWIAECMASIHAQTYKDVELIVIDDAQGSGAGAARNRGLELATGEYIAFCDADDCMAPDALEKLVAAMDGVDMVCGSFRKFGEFDSVVSHDTQVLETEHIAQYAIANLMQPMHHQMLSGCWAKLYKREWVQPFPALTTAEDMAFNYQYLRRCHRVRFLADVVYHNRKRTGSLSTTFDASNRKGLFGYLEALKHVATFLGPWYGKYEIERAIDSSKVYHSMLYFLRICQQEGGEPRDVLKRLYA